MIEVKVINGDIEAAIRYFTKMVQKDRTLGEVKRRARLGAETRTQRRKRKDIIAAIARKRREKKKVKINELYNLSHR